jgi:hypothetical protein
MNKIGAIFLRVAHLLNKFIGWLEKNVVNIIQITIVWCIITSAIPLLYSWFKDDTITIVDYIYFIFSFGRDLLLLLTIFLIIDKKYRFLIWPYLVYITIVFIWQIIATITKWDMGNPIAVIIIFSALLTGVIILLRKDLINKPKR